MSGYWATGNLTIATAPARVMTMEMTEAKIGRSIQKLEMFMVAARSLRRLLSGLLALQFFLHPRQGGSGGLRALGFGGPGSLGRCLFDAFQGCARTYPDRAIHHDLLARLEALENEPVVAVPIAHLHHPLFGLAVLDHPYIVALGALQHRPLRHQDGAGAGRALDQHPHELPRAERTLGVAHHGAHQEGACFLAEGGIGEADTALVGKYRSVRQHDLDRELAVGRELEPTRGKVVAIL